MISDWPLPVKAKSLNSFIGLVTFYNKFVPWFEHRLRPLRSLERLFHRRSIPMSSWTPDLVSDFETMKVAITSDPLLRRYDSSISTCLKTDWSAVAMGFILMQPAAAAQEAIRLLTTGDCTFDLLMSGGRLQPVRFGSRLCTERERHYHSFTGEVNAGRYAIAQLRQYLWGSHFYWVCDCSAVKEILECDGPIHQLRRWSQELMGYDFTVVHCPARLMRDVDALSRGRHLDKYVAQYEVIATSLRTNDASDRPAAYSPQ